MFDGKDWPDEEQYFVEDWPINSWGVLQMLDKTIDSWYTNSELDQNIEINQNSSILLLAKRSKALSSSNFWEMGSVIQLYAWFEC